LVAALGTVFAFAQADTPDAAWELTSCPDGAVTSADLGEEDSVTLIAQCTGAAPETSGDVSALSAESPQLLSAANWYLRFRLRRADPRGELRVGLVDTSGEAKYSVALDPGACRLLSAPARSGTKWSEVGGREWMDTTWWLDEEHIFELRYHASPQSVSVRFDWNYMAFVFVPVEIETETFSFRIHVADSADADSSVASFELWEFALEQHAVLNRW